MPLSTLDPKTALIVIDLQKGIVGFPTAHPAAAVVGQASALAKAFRERGLPVVLVNVSGGAPGRVEQPRPAGDRPPDWADLVPELNPQASDHRVTKRTWGAFTGTDLASYLKDQGVTQVVLSGISTSAGVESTARNAHELGFNVSFALDAMTDLSAESHAHSSTKVFPRLGETGSTADVLALLGQRGA